MRGFAYLSSPARDLTERLTSTPRPVGGTPCQLGWQATPWVPMSTGRAAPRRSNEPAFLQLEVARLPSRLEVQLCCKN